MAFWNRNRQRKVVPQTPGMQREQLIDKLRKNGISEYDIKVAIKEWETKRANLGFESK